MTLRKEQYFVAGLACLALALVGVVTATVLPAASPRDVVIGAVSTILAVGAIAAFAKWWPLATADAAAADEGRGRLRAGGSALMLATILVWIWALLVLLNAPQA